MLRLAEFQDLSEEELLRVIGTPVKINVRQSNPDYQGPEFISSVPEYLVEQTDIDYGTGLLSPTIAVSDFGLFYPFSAPPKGPGTGIPMPYASPEALFSMQDMLGPATDVWALGCSIMKVLIGCPPFGEKNRTFDDIVRNMEVIMGPLPEPYRTRWYELDPTGEPNIEGDMSIPVSYDPERARVVADERFEDTGTRDYLHWLIRKTKTMPIITEQANEIADQYEHNNAALPRYGDPSDVYLGPNSKHTYRLPREEGDQLFDLMSRIFKWDPAERISAAEVLNHPWFRNLRSETEGDDTLPHTTGHQGLETNPGNCTKKRKLTVSDNDAEHETEGGSLRKRSKSADADGAPHSTSLQRAKGQARRSQTIISTSRSVQNRGQLHLKSNNGQTGTIKQGMDDKEKVSELSTKNTKTVTQPNTLSNTVDPCQIMDTDLRKRQTITSNEVQNSSDNGRIPCCPPKTKSEVLDDCIDSQSPDPSPRPYKRNANLHSRSMVSKPSQSSLNLDGHQSNHLTSATPISPSDPSPALVDISGPDKDRPNLYHSAGDKPVHRIPSQESVPQSAKAILSERPLTGSARQAQYFRPPQGNPFQRFSTSTNILATVDASEEENTQTASSTSEFTSSEKTRSALSSNESTLASRGSGGLGGPTRAQPGRTRGKKEHMLANKHGRYESSSHRTDGSPGSGDDSLWSLDGQLNMVLKPASMFPLLANFWRGIVLHGGVSVFLGTTILSTSALALALLVLTIKVVNGHDCQGCY